MDNDSRRGWNANASWQWVLVFLINLPMPLYLSWLFFGTQLITQRVPFYTGVALACVTQIAVGFYFNGKDHKLARIITDGGLILAIAQFLPIIQFIAGCMGVVVGSAMARLDRDAGAGFRLLQGYAMTSVTGLCLMCSALAMGSLFPDPIRRTSAVRTWKRR